MRELEQLKKQWNDGARYRAIQANLCLGSDGLTLGAGTVVAKRNHDGSLAIDGEEARVLTLLSVAYRQPLDPSALRTIRRASDTAREGDECKAAMHIALAKLPKISDSGEAARRLFIADGLIAAGVAPRDIWTALEFDPAPLDLLEKYNQAEPRVPAGSGKPSGEWMSGSAAATAALAAARTAVGAVEARVPEIAQRLPGAALRLGEIAAHLNLVFDVLEQTFRSSPLNGGSLTGPVRGHPDWYYTQQQSQTTLGIIDRATGHTVADLSTDLAGGRQYVDPHTGAVVAQMEGDELVIRSATAAMAQAQTRTKKPNLCPEEPGPDLPGMIGARGLRSKGYENYMKLWLNPDEPTPPGFGYQLENPITEKLVYYDDCQHATGSMAEYKGQNIARIISWAMRAQRLDVLALLAGRFVRQATSQINASEGRPVVWYFAEQGTLDFARQVFQNADDPRLAEITLVLRRPPEVRGWWRDYAKRRRRRREAHILHETVRIES